MAGRRECGSTCRPASTPGRGRFLSDLPADVWQRLPSRADEETLIAAAREAYAIPASAGIVAAAGTQSLIQWLPQLASSGPVAIAEPTYNEHAPAWRLAGHDVIARADLDDLPQAVRHVVVVNPNNPDGRVISRAALARIAGLVKERGGWLVVDEAFADVEPEIKRHRIVRRSAHCGAAFVREILRPCGAAIGICGRAAADRAAHCAGARSLGLFRTGADHRRRRIARPGMGQSHARCGSAAGAASRHRVGERRIYDCRRNRIVSARAARRCRRGARVARGPHIWCRRFDWADDLLRFGLPPDDRDLERLAAALASSG